MSNRRSILQPPGLGRVIGDHAERIGDLERAGPGALGLDYAILEGGGTLPAGPTGDDYWWDMVAPSTEFTNAPDVFANATAVISAGPGTVNSGTFHGLSILQNGMYLALKVLQIGSLNADATVKHLSLYQDGIAGPDITYSGDFIFGGNANYMILGNGSNMEFWSIQDAPTNTILFRTVNAEASSYSCDTNLLILKIDSVPIDL